MKFIASLFLLLTLTACNGAGSDKIDAELNSAESVQADSVIKVNMTYDRTIDYNVKKIAVVPNNVAPWTGSLFITTESNILYRGDIDRGPFAHVSDDISEIAPLARKNMAGIILGKTNEGNIKAFVEINDDSEYRPLPLNKTPKAVEALCNVNRPDMNRIYAKLERDIIALDLVSPQENSYIGSAIIEDVKLTNEHCNLAIDTKDITPIAAPKMAVNMAVLSDSKIVFTTEESKRSPRLFVKDADSITAIDITGGITSAAPSQIDAIYVIPNSLGGVLRNGALIMADNASQRLIYISLDFLEKRLDQAPP